MALTKKEKNRLRLIDINIAIKKKELEKEGVGKNLIKGLDKKITKDVALESIPSSIRNFIEGHKKRRPFNLPQKPASFATGFAEGASLGSANLFPSFKKEKERAIKEAPKSRVAGEVASYLTPGTGGAKAFRLGGKVASKIVPAVGKKVLPKIVKKAIGGGFAGLITGGVRGTTESGKITPKEGIKKALVEGATGAVFSAGLQSASKPLKKSAAKFINTVIKPSVAAKRIGFNAEDIYRLKVGGTVQQIIKKSSNKANKLTAEVGDIVEKYVAKNPNKKIFSNEIFTKTLKQIDAGKGKGILIDEMDLASKTVRNIFAGAQKTGKVGNLDARGLRELKRELQRIAFKKTSTLTDDDVVRRKAAKLIWVNVEKEFEKFVPEAAKKSKDISKLVIIENVAKDAVDRIGKKNSISIRDMMLLSAGGLSAPTGPIGPITAGSLFAGKKYLETGRGGSLLRTVGSVSETPQAQRFASQGAAKTINTLLQQSGENEKPLKKQLGRTLTQQKQGRQY